MAEYAEIEEELIVPNAAAQWQIAYDPADDYPAIAPTRIVLISHKRKRRPRVYARDAAEIAELLDQTALHDREAIYVLLLDDSRRVIGIYVLGLGGPSSSVADPLSLLRVVLNVDPVGGVVLVHNHPSGRATASPEDVSLTDRVVALLDFHDQTLVDHVIVGSGDYFSFADAGFFEMAADAGGKY